jgi:hypothetical protein
VPALASAACWPLPPRPRRTPRPWGSSWATTWPTTWAPSGANTWATTCSNTWATTCIRLGQPLDHDLLPKHVWDRFGRFETSGVLGEHQSRLFVCREHSSCFKPGESVPHVLPRQVAKGDGQEAGSKGAKPARRAERRKPPKSRPEGREQARRGGKPRRADPTGDNQAAMTGGRAPLGNPASRASERPSGDRGRSDRCAGYGTSTRSGPCQRPTLPRLSRALTRK